MKLDKLEEVWMAHREFPYTWSRYLSLDPGYSTCACLLFVVPPPQEFGHRVIIEDEVYLHHSTANDLAIALEPKMAGKVYQSFVIDWHAGRSHTMTGGPRIVDQYAAVFAAHGLASEQTGHTFQPGSDNVPARADKVRDWMSTANNGPVLRLVLQSTPMTQREFKLYKRVLKKEAETDKPVDKHNHAMACIEYMAMADPQYIEPEPSQRISPRVRAMQALDRQLDQLEGVGSHNSINLGPPRSSPV